MKGPAALVVGVLALAGILWLALGGGRPPVPVGPSGSNEQPSAAAPKPSLPPPAPSKVPGKADLSQRKEVEGPPSAAPKPGNTWKVLVVEKETGRPVPGAQVLVLDRSAPKDREHFEHPGFFEGEVRAEDLLENFGHSYSADSKGVAWIPPFRRPREGGLVGARKGNLWCVIPHRRPLLPPLKVELSREDALAIQVLDNLGKPLADVPVGISFSYSSGFGPLRRKFTGNPGGIARFRHIRAQLRDRWKEEERIMGRAALLLPLKTPLEKIFDPRDLPRNSMVFRLPPTGKVEVLVRGPRGPVADGKWRVAIVSVNKWGGGEPPSFTVPVIPEGEVKKGKALFPFVGLGLYLKFRISRLSPPVYWTGRNLPPAAEGPGPVFPGQTVTFQVDLKERPLLSGRVLLPSGKPAARKRLVFRLKDREGKDLQFGPPYFLRTDGEGRFRLELKTEEPRERKSVLTVYLSSEGSAPPMEAELDLSPPIPSGETSLGDIRLSPLPLLASGRVVDPDWKPVPKATITSFVKIPSPGAGGIPRYHQVTPFPVLADEEGRFHVFGKTSSKVLFLQPWKMDWLDSPKKPVPAGSTNNILVLRRGGTVTSAFFVDPGVPLQRLELILTSRNGEGREIPMIPSKIEGNRVTWTKIFPGKGTLSVALPGQTKPLLVIRDIPVREGEVTRDPRLEGVDLRGKIQLLNLELVDEGGRSILVGWIHWGKGFARLSRVRPGFPLLLPPGKLETIWITGPGFKPRKTKVTGPRMKVTLEKGFPVRLVYAGEAPLPGPSFSVGLALQPTREERASQMKKFGFTLPALPYVYFGKKGIVQVRVCSPGTYRVSWVLRGNGTPRFGGCSILVRDPPAIHVADVPGVQVFKVTLPAEALEKAMAFAKK